MLNVYQQFPIHSYLSLISVIMTLIHLSLILILNVIQSYLDNQMTMSKNFNLKHIDAIRTDNSSDISFELN